MEHFYFSAVLALIFASDDPISESEIAKVIKDTDGDDSITAKEIEIIIEEANKLFNADVYPFKIIKLAGGYTFGTKPELSSYLGHLASEKSKKRLTQAALETLAIIAYKQPVSKPEVEAIRGVNSDYIIGSLLERNLVKISGRAESIGRALLYSTTEEFLKYFGLHSLKDLPKPKEIAELLSENDLAEHKRKLIMQVVEEQLELEFGDDDKDES